MPLRITHTLAVLAVSDLPRARDWYTKLFGREPDNDPMPSLTEWRTTDTGFVQVSTDATPPGAGSLNLAVEDIDAARAALVDAGLEPGEITGANKGVRLCPITDPDGNTITLIGGFRPDYDS